MDVHIILICVHTSENVTKRDISHTKLWINYESITNRRGTNTEMWSTCENIPNWHGYHNWAGDMLWADITKRENAITELTPVDNIWVYHQSTGKHRDMVDMRGYTKLTWLPSPSWIHTVRNITKREICHPWAVKTYGCIANTWIPSLSYARHVRICQNWKDTVLGCGHLRCDHQTRHKQSLSCR